MKYCSRCGAAMEPSAAFCPNCGRSTADDLAAAYKHGYRSGVRAAADAHASLGEPWREQPPDTQSVPSTDAAQTAAQPAEHATEYDECYTAAHRYGYRAPEGFDPYEGYPPPPDAAEKKKKARRPSPFRRGFLITALVFLALAAAAFAAEYLRGGLWRGVAGAAFFGLFALAFFALSLSPKKRNNVFGLRKGLKKGSFMFLMVLLALVAAGVIIVITEGYAASALAKIKEIF